MLPNIDYSELPRALQHMLERGQTVKTLPRRSFLKLAGATGLALGAFPHIALADQVCDPEILLHLHHLDFAKLEQCNSFTAEP